MTGGRPPSFSRLISGTQISRRNDPAYDRRESLGVKEKTSRTRHIYSKVFSPGVLYRFLIEQIEQSIGKPEETLHFKQISL